MNNILSKFRFTGRGVVLNAPTAIEAEFVEAGFMNSFEISLKSNNTVVFVNNKKEFLDFLKTKMKYIEADSILWFAYPKGSSGIKTDINRDTLRELADAFKIRPVSQISIDNVWSALRFRPIESLR